MSTPKLGKSCQSTKHFEIKWNCIMLIKIKGHFHHNVFKVALLCVSPQSLCSQRSSGSPDDYCHLLSTLSSHGTTWSEKWSGPPVWTHLFVSWWYNNQKKESETKLDSRNYLGRVASNHPLCPRFALVVSDGRFAQTTQRCEHGFFHFAEPFLHIASGF